jgi:hypothetical protein
MAERWVVMAAKKKKSEGKYVLARCQLAGMHIGTIESQDAEFLTLVGARRIWYWKGAASASEIALSGMRRECHDQNKVSVEVPRVRLRQFDVIELLDVTAEARGNLAEIKPWKA